MKHAPYDYQVKAYTDVLAAQAAGHRAVGVYIPTRGGKSIVALQLVEHFIDEPGGVWFIAHTNILISQMSDELTDNGIRHALLTPKSPELQMRVQVMSKDTLFNRIDRMLSSGWKLPRLIIVDEAHLSMSAHYQEILDKCSTCLLVGLSASWIRLDKKPFNPPFTHLVMGPSIKQLQERGKLCEIDTFVVERAADISGVRKNTNGDYNRKQLEDAVDKPFIIKDVVSKWEQLAKNKKTLAFCAGIKHAQDMAEEFNAAGYPARALSSQNADEIKDTLEAFYRNEFKVLVSVDLFIMGFTVRDCEAIIQARPTQSLMIYLQCVGRGMMTSPGKKALINIDAVNNFFRHGPPEMDREWDLNGSPRKPFEGSQYKRCPSCQRPIPTFATICPYCAYEFPQTVAVADRTPEEVEGELVPISALAVSDKSTLVVRIAREAHDLKSAIRVAKSMGANHQAAWYAWCVVLKKPA